MPFVLPCYFPWKFIVQKLFCRYEAKLLGIFPNLIKGDVLMTKRQHVRDTTAVNNAATTVTTSNTTTSSITTTC